MSPTFPGLQATADDDVGVAQPPLSVGKVAAMRMTALAAAGLLTSCVAPSPIPPAPGDATGHFRVEVRGDDRLGADYSSNVWVVLESEAHVAVFRLLEDQGAILVWPFSETSPRTMPAGPTMLPERTISEQRIARWRASYLFPVAARGPRSAQPLRMVLVVASSRPLPLEAYLTDHEALRRDLGGAFTNVTLATDGILDLLVDDRDARDWAWACSGTPFWCRGR